MKTCLDCSKTFDRMSVVVEGSACPTLRCSGHIIEIDDTICHTIAILNKLEHKTIECCSGHTDGGNDPYILFDKDTHLNSFPELPEGFRSECNSDGYVKIFMELPKMGIKERHEALMKSSSNLLKWAIDLRGVHFVVVEFLVRNGSKTTNKISRIKKWAKEEADLNFPFIPEVHMHDEDVTVIEYSYNFDPGSIEDFEEKVEAFANKHNLDLFISVD